ncbi:MAG TPA: hypothetical protein VJO99_10025 [Burkholderiaceae bacterium]|nr:hypothetical protein [Burkholderiaceae bacterium]
MTTVASRRAELGAIEVLPGRDGVVVGLVGPNAETLRIEMPAWTVHQLMRCLPRIDAALHGDGDSAPGVIAYPIAQWSVRSVGQARSVALSMLSDRRVASTFMLGPDEARAIHRALGDAIKAAGADLDADLSARSAPAAA